MTVLIIYESMYGNTESIARAIAGGFGPQAGVRLVEVSQAPVDLPDDVELVVVGAPTHGHGLSRPQSRAGAAKEKPVISAETGVREWAAAVGISSRRPAMATFDTRFDKPRWLTGSAAASLAKLLRRRGFAVQEPPQSFFVEHTLGPLRDGEMNRAHAWAATLAADLRSAGKEPL
ncbi:MAG: flavodoxin family protein [Hamadaea sp.]|uniref:flavodoxin family protein n=1 Tax=Hamadaea sp. TaxID=2024425 RepID=UPI0017FA1E79|nr:flavodoxin domain-containing protein [Hamadaea sp.]NUT18852.1 flavodoxin family protein [Hamadaea sp.]